MQVPVQYIQKFGNANSKPLPVIEHLVLESSEEPFAGRIVRRAAFLRHGSQKVCFFHARKPARPAVMSSPVEMHYQPFSSLKIFHGQVEHAVYQVRIGAGLYGSACHHAVVTVNDRRKVDLACRDLKLRDVGKPFNVRSFSVNPA